MFDTLFALPLLHLLEICLSCSTKMPSKRAVAKSCASPKKKRSPTMQKKKQKQRSNQGPQHLTQRVTRSQTKQQRKSTADRHVLETKPPSHRSDSDSLGNAGTKLPSSPDLGKTAPQSSHPLPLTQESLQLLNVMNSVEEVEPIASASAASEPSEKSINAYAADYEAALNDRGIYLFDGKSNDLPEDLHKLQEALYSPRASPEPGDVEAGHIRQFLKKVRSESSVVSLILPEIVPLKQLVMDNDIEVGINRPWRRCLTMCPDLKPSPRAPNPNLTIGWSSKVFPFQNATRSLRSFQCPVASNITLSWPLFTAEVEGPIGSLRVAQLHNLHSAAIMLSNLQELAKAARNEDAFFNKIHTLSLELTTDTVQLSYYWATCGQDGQVRLYGDVLNTWGLRSKSSDPFKEAYRCTRNAIELVRARAHASIHANMAAADAIFAARPSPQAPSLKSSGVGNPVGKTASVSGAPDAAGRDP